VMKLDFIIARFIGGEFIILFRDTTKEESLAAIEQFKNAMGRVGFKKTPELRISVSIGMAESKSQDNSIEACINRAAKNILTS